MRRAADVARWILPIVAGVGAGVATGALRPDRTDRVIEIRERLVADVAETPRLHFLQVRSDAATSMPSVVPTVAEEPRLTRPELAVSGEDAFQELLSRHDAEPVDHSWSSAARSALWEHGAVTASRAGASLVDVDCRSTSCELELSWPNHAVAARQTDAVVFGDLGIRCGHAVAIPDDNGREPFRMSVLLTCDDAINGGLAPH